MPPATSGGAAQNAAGATYATATAGLRPRLTVMTPDE